MKKKFTITFKVDTHYPGIDTDKVAKKLSKDFEQWLKDWASSSGEDIMPILYEPPGKKDGEGDWEHDPNGTVRVKIKLDNKIILDTWWDKLSDDF